MESGSVNLDITECGDVMVNAYMDECGNRKIYELLEDGTKIIIIVDYIIAIEMSTIKPIQILCEDI